MAARRALRVDDNFRIGAFSIYDPIIKDYLGSNGGRSVLIDNTQDMLQLTTIGLRVWRTIYRGVNQLPIDCPVSKEECTDLADQCYERLRGGDGYDRMIGNIINTPMGRHPRRDENLGAEYYETFSYNEAIRRVIEMKEPTAYEGECKDVPDDAVVIDAALERAVEYPDAKLPIYSLSVPVPEELQYDPIFVQNYDVDDVDEAGDDEILDAEARSDEAEAGDDEPPAAVLVRPLIKPVDKLHNLLDNLDDMCFKRIEILRSGQTLTEQLDKFETMENRVEIWRRSFLEMFPLFRTSGWDQASVLAFVRRASFTEQKRLLEAQLGGLPQMPHDSYKWGFIMQLFLLDVKRWDDAEIVSLFNDDSVDDKLPLLVDKLRGEMRDTACANYIARIFGVKLLPTDEWNIPDIRLLFSEKAVSKRARLIDRMQYRKDPIPALTSDDFDVFRAVDRNVGGRLDNNVRTIAATISATIAHTIVSLEEIIQRHARGEVFAYPVRVRRAARAQARLAEQIEEYRERFRISCDQKMEKELKLAGAAVTTEIIDISGRTHLGDRLDLAPLVSRAVMDQLFREIDVNYNAVCNQYDALSAADHEELFPIAVTQIPELPDFLVRLEAIIGEVHHTYRESLGRITPRQIHDIVSECIGVLIGVLGENLAHERMTTVEISDFNRLIDTMGMSSWGYERGEAFMLKSNAEKKALIEGIQITRARNSMWYMLATQPNVGSPGIISEYVDTVKVMVNSADSRLWERIRASGRMQTQYDLLIRKLNNYLVGIHPETFLRHHRRFRIKHWEALELLKLITTLQLGTRPCGLGGEEINQIRTFKRLTQLSISKFSYLRRYGRFKKPLPRKRFLKMRMKEGRPIPCDGTDGKVFPPTVLFGGNRDLPLEERIAVINDNNHLLNFMLDPMNVFDEVGDGDRTPYSTLVEKQWEIPFDIEGNHANETTGRPFRILPAKSEGRDAVEPDIKLQSYFSAPILFGEMQCLECFPRHIIFRLADSTSAIDENISEPLFDFRTRSDEIASWFVDHLVVSHDWNASIARLQTIGIILAGAAPLLEYRSETFNYRFAIFGTNNMRSEAHLQANNRKCVTVLTSSLTINTGYAVAEFMTNLEQNDKTRWSGVHVNNFTNLPPSAIDLLVTQIIAMKGISDRYYLAYARYLENGVTIRNSAGWKCENAELIPAVFTQDRSMIMVGILLGVTTVFARRDRTTNQFIYRVIQPGGNLRIAPRTEPIRIYNEHSKRGYLSWIDEIAGWGFGDEDDDYQRGVMFAIKMMHNNFPFERAVFSNSTARFRSGLQRGYRLYIDLTGEDNHFQRGLTMAMSTWTEAEETVIRDQFDAVGVDAAGGD